MTNGTIDEKFMKRAIELAETGLGRTSPNPMVGAVLLKNGEIIAEGRHLKAGAQHAEVQALDAAGERAKGSTLYVNLEPCSHFGRTPPCAPVVVAAGVSRVVSGMEDPNPLVAGKGFKILREAGIAVESGVLDAECRRLNEVFIKYITTGLPFIIVKGAMTLDGKIASPTGDSQWISCKESRDIVHKLRGEIDAVLVGVGTMLKDDPRLTSRVENKIKDPYRIVIDSFLKTPVHSRFCDLAADGKTIIITTIAAPEEREKELSARGCIIMRTQADSSGRPDLELALRELCKLGIISIMVEGGGETNFSFLRSKLVDKVMIFISPRLLGGAKSKTMFSGEGFPRIAEAHSLKEFSVSQAGADILVEGYL